VKPARAPSSFVVAALTQAIHDQRGHATRYRSLARKMPPDSEMAEDCAAIAEAFEASATTLQGHLAEATNR
jgi:hypothetical protein